MKTYLNCKKTSLTFRVKKIESLVALSSISALIVDVYNIKVNSVAFFLNF